MRIRARILPAISFVAVTAMAVAPALADAKKPSGATECTDVVKAAVVKAYPGSKVTKCRRETEDGREQFEVKLTRKDGGALELDVSLDGKILQTEEVVALSAIPDAVAKAFSAKYPKAKASRAEKQTQADGTVSYELAFTNDKGKRQEATFAADGKFVEEE